MKKYFRALTIAGSDSGGGAGVQADLKTFTVLGVYGASVFTALTAQNTMGVCSIHEVPPAFVQDQLNAVLEDIGTDATKIGMLFSPEIIEVVAKSLSRFGLEHVVLDPVMVAKGGSRLLKNEAVTAMKERIFPLTEIVTPNLPEAEYLLGRKLFTESDIEAGAKELLGLGARAVLVKGGHGKDPNWCRDCLVSQEGVRWFQSPRVDTKNLHGTGCTLSAAIAAFLARSLPLQQAVEQGREYLMGAIERGAGYQLGQGHGPVGHFEMAK